jgi:hypothetical protein
MYKVLYNLHKCYVSGNVVEGKKIIVNYTGWTEPILNDMANMICQNFDFHVFLKRIGFNIRIKNDYIFKRLINIGVSRDLPKTLRDYYYDVLEPFCDCFPFYVIIHIMDQYISYRIKNIIDQYLDKDISLPKIII